MGGIVWPVQNLDFSKKKPSGIHKNDIIITFGVGCGMILSVFRVISSTPHYASDKEQSRYPWKERWPWSLKAENLSCKFAENWYANGLKLYDLSQIFLKEYPQSCITANGNNSFGHFNFGGDKLQLNPMFAKFLIQRVFNLNY